MSRTFIPSSRALTLLPMLAAGLLAAGAAPGSYGESVPRVTSPVNAASVAQLAGNTHPLAQSRYDRGRAPASLSGRMLVVLKRSPEQESQLDQLLSAQQDPASPNYHKWLTPSEFGKRFGVADADVQSVTGYLSSQGFTVGRIYGSRMAVEVTGTAEQIRRTFHTEIHQYTVGGKSFFANNSDPKIPTALAPVVAGVASLNNFRTAPASHATPVSFDRTTHVAKPLYDVPNTASYGVSPADLSTIYDIPAASNAYGQGGQGIAIGFVGDSNINVNYVANYRNTFGLPAKNPIVVVDGDDPGVTADAYIAYKQIEIAGAVAPNATIYYYTSDDTDYDTGLDFAIVRAIDDNTVQVLGIGFQSCETALGNAGTYFINQGWRQAAAQGMTVVAAAGNSGSAACDTPGSANAAPGGLAVNGYASSASVTAVGGTDFNYGTTPNYATYWRQNTTAYSSALSYIPEQVWNDSNTGGDATPGTSYLLASGGGVSTAGLDGVSKPIPQPSYQAGVVPSSITTAARALPDVSFFAGSGNNNTMGYNNTAYLFCMANNDCAAGASTPQFTISGGTEVSSAVFAGVMALVTEYQNTLVAPTAQNIGLGNANPALYNFVKSGLGTYHDITVGTNEVKCSNLNCTNNYMSKYAAATGYDAATGLGSFDVTSLVSKWKSPNTTASSTTLSVTNPSTGAPVTTVQHSQPVQLTIQVFGNGTVAPTGDVAVTDNSPLPSQADQGVSALTTITQNGNKIGLAVNSSDIFLPGGTYQLSARYGGDSTYGPSVSSPVTVTVTPEACIMALYGHNVNYSGSTVPYGSPVQITAEPYSTDGPSFTSTPSGSLQVYDGASLVTVLPINAEGATTFNSNLLSVGSHSIVLKFPGDASFQSCQTNAFNFSVTSASTQTTLNPSTTNVGEGGNNADGLTAVVISTTLPSNGSAPTGTVTFSTNPAQTATLVPGFDPNGNAIATASVTVSPSQVPANGLINATYNPTAGGNYTASTSPNVQFTQTTSAYSGTSSISFTLTDSNGTYAAAPGLSFPTNDNLSLNINVATDTPNASYVTIYANGTAISGQIYPDTNGNVTFTIPRQNGFLLLPSGQVQFTIQYDGWEEYIFGYPYYQSPPVSTNLAVNIIDNRTSADFSLQTAAYSNQQSPLTAASPSASYALQLTSIYNFQSAYANTPINLTCAFPTNPGLQCSFSSSAVTLGGSGFATSTMTVSPANGYTIASNDLHPAPRPRWWIAGGGATMVCVFLLGMPGRRRNWQSIASMLILLAVSFGAGGCGTTSAATSTTSNSTKSAGLGTSQPNSGTVVAAGTYTAVVTATTTTNTKIVHNLAVRVVVTNQ